MSYVKSPKTGRMVKVGSETYKSLERSGYRLSGLKRHRMPSKSTRGAMAVAKRAAKGKATHRVAKGRGGATRGWSPARRVTERRALAGKCGSRCFLKPPTGFPVCDSNCKTDCRGVVAARVRAAQYKYRDIEQAARYLERKACGRKSA
jgi:hypothetical protein